MLTIKAQDNPGDTNIRRLMGQLGEKQMAVERAIQNIQTRITSGSQADPTFTDYSLSLQVIVQDPDLVRDLEFIFGSEWQTIALGNVL